MSFGASARTAAGVYRSTDGGRTWQNVGLRDSRNIGKIRIHPHDVLDELSQRLIAAVGDYEELLRPKVAAVNHAIRAAGIAPVQDA